ncbi:MAG: Acetyltransferase domain [Patescibacteria group bacterium]|nr:GNAT family N-acetyltransferase [Candidatus Saccharibacteria bacterium]MDQ5963049.1 Acetyltransferase domain [Patescibacteria group bacterium]
MHKKTFEISSQGTVSSEFLVPYAQVVTMAADIYPPDASVDAICGWVAGTECRTVTGSNNSERVLGFMCLGQSLSPATAWIEALVVSEESRGFAIGKGLVIDALTVSRAKGYEAVALDAVEGSEAFYAQLGFREIPDDNIDAYMSNDPSTPMIFHFI